jgi:hypothetical protein
VELFSFLLCADWYIMHNIAILFAIIISKVINKIRSIKLIFLRIPHFNSLKKSVMLLN